MSISVFLTAIDSGHFGKNNTGLGNVLFQISSAYGISKKYNKVFGVDRFKTYLLKLRNLGYDHEETIFRNIHVKDIVYDEIVSERQLYFAMYDDNIVKDTDKNILLKGYLQSHMYFDEYRNDILNMFKPDAKSLKYIHDKYPDIDKNSVSLHLRTIWGPNIQTCLDYYRETIKHFKDEPTFYIFSDDTEKSKEIADKLNIKYIVVEGNVDYIDLWMMSLCKHNIVSFSTFSWWGAYLNENPEKIVIYPNDALRICFGLQPQPVLLERKTQHYFPEWKCLYSPSIV